MSDRRRRGKMVAATKPIRPTVVGFDTSAAKQKFENYASQYKKTESVGMNNLREMMRKHKEKRM